MTVEKVKKDTVELASETLRGDVRDAILDNIRNLQKPWQQMTQWEQSNVNHAIENVANNLVRQAVRLIAADGRKTIKAELEQITVKDGIKATLTLSKSDENRHDLIDSQGLSVLIIVANADKFDGQRADAETDPDQPELAIDNEGEGEGEDGEDKPVFDKGKIAKSEPKKPKGGKRSKKK